jgi:hypothetical protein
MEWFGGLPHLSACLSDIKLSPVERMYNRTVERSNREIRIKKDGVKWFLDCRGLPSLYIHK